MSNYQPRTGALALIAILLTTSLAGCSSAKESTCEEFASKDDTGRILLTQSLIRAHELDPDSNPMATAKVAQTIYTFCGVDAFDSLQGKPVTATQNQQRAIDEAIDWASFSR